MRVTSSSTPAPGHALLRNPHLQQPAAPRREAPADATDAAKAGASGRGRGVIRNLEAGHFKGVADVRLRINFHDELAQRAAARGGEALADGAESLVATMVEAVSSSLAVAGPEISSPEGALTDFAAAVHAASADRGEIDLDGVGDQIEAAFKLLQHTRGGEPKALTHNPGQVIDAEFEPVEDEEPAQCEDTEPIESAFPY